MARNYQKNQTKTPNGKNEKSLREMGQNSDRSEKEVKDKCLPRLCAAYETKITRKY